MADKSAIEAAQALFAEASLPFPPLPDDFASQLQPFGDRVFSTRELESGPYAMNALVEEAVQGSGVADYALLGLDGYGVSSWAMHYVLVRRSIALFLQFPWGGAYSNAEAQRQAVTNGLAFAEALQRAMERAAAQGRIADGERLVVKVSGFTGSGWGWFKPGVAPNEGAWRSGDVYEGVAEAIERLLAD